MASSRYFGKYFGKIYFEAGCRLCHKEIASCLSVHCRRHLSHIFGETEFHRKQMSGSTVKMMLKKVRPVFYSKDIRSAYFKFQVSN